MTARIAIGIGCRRGCPAEAIETLVRQALDHVGAAVPTGLFTLGDKAAEPGLVEAAWRLGLDVVPLPRMALQARSADIRTYSVQAERLFGVPSVAEAAALAGAGDGSKLAVPRIANLNATCAVAVSRP